MKKDDGFFKKTQDNLHDNVVPHVKEELDKGAAHVSGFVKETGKKAGELVEAAGEKTREAGKALSEKSEKILPNKNDAFKHFKKDVDDVGKKAVRVKDDMSKQVLEKADSAVDFTKRKSEKAAKEISKGSKEVAAATEEVSKKGDKALNGNESRKKVVRTAAGAVVLAAAAAGAYLYHRKRREEDEAIKAEFSEKMKKWNELEGDALVEAGHEHPMKMKVRPTRVYRLNDNALLGDDIILNITVPEEALAEFNPDEVAEPINTMEEFRRKAGEIAGQTGEKARQVAESIGDKAKEAYYVLADKAGDLKDQVGEKEFEIRSGEASFKKEDTPIYRNESKDTWQPMEGLDQEAKEITEEMTENTTEDAWRVEEEIDAGSRHSVQPPKKTVAGGVGEVEENKMETEEGDAVPPDHLWVKEELGGESRDLESENISWDEDESVLMQRTEELRRKSAEGFHTVKDKVTEAKDFVVDKYHEMKPEEATETEDDLFNEEYHVTIHNRGNKDYFFSPMLIQRYNSNKRVTTPVPAHGDGTTLEQRIIKPGETYTGKLVLQMTLQDDALIMFEDMLMKNSVAILVSEEPDNQFLLDESRDLEEDFLFEGFEGDLEDYDFSDEEMTQLNDLDIEDAEELNFDFPDEDPKE